MQKSWKQLKIRKIVFASSNRDKYRELQTGLFPSHVDLLFGPDQLPPGYSIEVDEDCQSYAGNAIKKALAWSDRLCMPVLADDSGLEVFSLGWAPGILSARVASDDRGRIAWLLNSLEGVADRRARFVAALALFDPFGGIWLLTEGVCQGMILDKAEGNSGFGYDPVFVPAGYDSSIACLGDGVKARISHRAIAAEGMARMLENCCMVE